jgi:hypothetical protein
VDGLKDPAEGVIESLMFTPDGSRVCYVDRNGAKKRLVFGETKGDEFDDVLTFTFCGRPDRMAYVGRHARKFCVVAGGRRSQDYDEVWSPVFENQDRSLSFNARDGNDFWRVTMTLE